MNITSQSREAPTIVNDKNIELRKEVIHKASELQKYVHFEASMKPHLEKMEKIIEDLNHKCDEHVEKIREYDEKIKEEQKITETLKAHEIDPSEVEKKVQKVFELETKLRTLLKQKEEFIHLSQQSIQNDPEEDFEFN